MSIYPEKKWTMTDEQLTALTKACRPVPYMVVGGLPPRSQQQNANDAWATLGAVLGFDWKTVRPAGTDQRAFYAVPTEPPEQRKAREDAEKAAVAAAEVESLRRDAAALTARADAIEAAEAARR